MYCIFSVKVLDVLQYCKFLDNIIFLLIPGYASVNPLICFKSLDTLIFSPGYVSVNPWICFSKSLDTFQ